MYPSRLRRLDPGDAKGSGKTKNRKIYIKIELFFNVEKIKQHW